MRFLEFKNSYPWTCTIKTLEYAKTLFNYLQGKGFDKRKEQIENNLPQSIKDFFKPNQSNKPEGPIIETPASSSAEQPVEKTSEKNPDTVKIKEVEILPTQLGGSTGAQHVKISEKHYIQKKDACLNLSQEKKTLILKVNIMPAAHMN